MTWPFLAAWLPSVPMFGLLIWLWPEGASGPWLIAADLLWFIIGLTIWLIAAHRSQLHRRMHWVFLVPYLSLKWGLIGIGAYCLVGLYVLRLGWIGAAIFFLIPFIYGVSKELNGRRSAPESTPRQP